MKQVFERKIESDVLWGMGRRKRLHHIITEMRQVKQNTSLRVRSLIHSSGRSTRPGRFFCCLGSVLLFLLFVVPACIAGGGWDISVFWYLDQEQEPPPGSRPMDLSSPAFEVDFSLPADCRKLDQYYDTYGMYTDMTQVRLLARALDYCRTEALLAGRDGSVEHDYVSSLDFSSLSLDLIPYSVRCTGIGGNEWFEFCDRVNRGDQSLCYGGPCRFPLSYARFIHRPPKGVNQPESDSSWMLYQGFDSVDPESCRLRDGTFLGTIIVSAERRVVCRYDDDEDGVRVILKGTGDFNGDGYLDALLEACKESAITSVVGCDQFLLTRKNGNSDPYLLPDSLLK